MKNVMPEIKDAEWNKVGLPIDGKSLMSSLTLVETEILELIETRRELSLTDILNAVSWPAPIILMSIGGLIREKVVIAKRKGCEIVISFHD
jgi:hypothetical protein